MIKIDGDNLSLEDFIKITRQDEKIKLTKEAVDKVNKARAYTDQLVADDKLVYGITTGFGKFSDVVIQEKETKKLQRNLIISHACGVGEALDKDIARGIMLLRINALAKGNSGIRLSTLETMIDMLNKGVTTLIPEKGSLGASGDLAPLAHMVLVMIGEGEAIYDGEKMPGRQAMEKAGIDLVELTSKEGLALINGTQVMTSVGAHAVYDGLKLSRLADLATALTSEALNGITDAYDEKVSLVRPHQGQIDTAANLLRILEGSKNTSRQGELRTQDAYSLRCVPQIHGGTKDCLEYVRTKLEIEMNSVTDNPLIFVDEDQVFSAGNFHGQPVALSFDFMSIGLAELANVSERRLERLVNPALSEGLPAFLVEGGGLNSGFMIVQYSAASLVSENKVLAHPASVDSIPSSANQEDHVSMGTIAARHAYEILSNSRKVVAMEILAACQAIDLRGAVEGLAPATRAAYDLVREEISTLDEDRVMYLDINRLEEMIMDESILDAVEAVVGELA